MRCDFRVERTSRACEFKPQKIVSTQLCLISGMMPVCTPLSGTPSPLASFIASVHAGLGDCGCLLPNLIFVSNSLRVKYCVQRSYVSESGLRTAKLGLCRIHPEVTASTIIACFSFG